MENSYNFLCSLHLGNICFLAAGLFYYENQTWFYSWCLFPLKLTAEKKVDRRLLPPKKILGKNSKSLVERRQKELELYLQTLLQQFPQATPTPLTNFLHFHLYVSTTYKQVCSSWFRITSVWSGGQLGLHYSKENEVRESCWLIRSRCSHSF